MKNRDFFSIRTVTITFVLFMCMYFLINYSPYGLSRLVEITGGHSILDMEMQGYSVDRAYEMLDALGEVGRGFYIKHIIPLDFPFPLTYGLFYFSVITLIYKSISSKITKPWLIGFVGLFATLFDWLENFMIIYLLQKYPHHEDGVVKVASMFTQLKSTFTVISLLLIIAGMLIIGFKKVLSKAQIKQVEKEVSSK